jgi:muramoyltetrapeptide carboxypeptidase
MKIGVVAPASRITPGLAGEVRTLAESLYPAHVELHFHPQCFETDGHFAGHDGARAEAFLDAANDPGIDAVWFARGGYGSGRIAEQVCANLSAAAREKTYLGYSDLGFLLAGLTKAGARNVVHGPMPADLTRAEGETAVARALRYLVENAPDTIEPNALAAPSAAFNITVLSHLLGTPLEPDLRGLVLMLEDVSEHHYRIDRALHHITSQRAIRRVAGIRLGRCSLIPPNDPAFGEDEEEIARHWCSLSGIPWLGRADIGHDVDNKVVPFGHVAQA